MSGTQQRTPNTGSPAVTGDDTGVAMAAATKNGVSKGPATGWPRRLVVLVPYLWLAAFFLLPFVIVLKISLSETAIAQPPYVPVLDPAQGWEGLKEFFGALSFRNYSLLGCDWLYLTSYPRRLEIAAV